MISTFIIILHILVCVALILIVLLQTGKGSDIGAAFGGASQTVFGASGAAPIMTKITAGAAIIFMLTSIILAKISSSDKLPSVLKDEQKKEEKKETKKEKDASSTADKKDNAKDLLDKLEGKEPPIVTTPPAATPPIVVKEGEKGVKIKEEKKEAIKKKVDTKKNVAPVNDKKEEVKKQENPKQEKKENKEERTE